MKQTVTLGLMLLCYLLSAQQTIGGFSSYGTLNYGDTISVTITNQGTSPATFYVPDPHPGRGAITYSDSALLDYLQSIAAQHADLEDKKEAVADSVAMMIKSEMVVHRQGIFNAWSADSFDRIYAKKYSAMGAFHGQSSRRCGDQCELFASILMKLGWFAPSDIRSVTLDTLHSLSEVMIRGRYKLYDLDVNEPFLTIPFSGSQNGSASADDLKNNPDLIDAAPYFYSHTYWGEVIRLNLKTRSTYKQLWVANTPHYDVAMNYVHTQNVGGWVTLCPSCALEFSYVKPYYMDVTTTQGADTYQRFTAFRDSANSGVVTYADSMWLLIQDYFGVSATNARTVFKSKPYIKTSERFLITCTQEVPTVEVKIPAGISPITGNELHFPGYIMNVQGGAVSVLGNYLPSGYSSQLWAEESPSTANKDVQYLADEHIFARQSEMRLKVSYNPRLYDFLNGFAIDQLGTPDTLVVGKTINGIPVFETVLSEPKQPASSRLAYPNPTSGAVYIPTEGSEISVTNTLGQLVMTVPCTGNVTRLVLPENGLYFVTTKTGTQKVFVQK